MRYLAVIVFVASLLAAAAVLAAPSKAAWNPPVSLGTGFAPDVKIDDGTPVVALVRTALEPRELRVFRGGRRLARVRVPRAGRLVAFGTDRDGTVVALRERRARPGAPQRVLALEHGRWRAISSPAGSAVDARLQVADSGAAIAVWMQYEGRRPYVTAAVRRPGARRFGRPERISGRVTRAGQPIALAVDAAGNAAVTFAERRDLWLWRTHQTPQRIHDATDRVAAAFAAAVAVSGPHALAVFTRLEDLEPPRYRASVAYQVDNSLAEVVTVAQDVSALDVAAGVDAAGTPLAVTSRIGPPYALAVHRRAASWETLTTIAATEPPSELSLEPGILAWTELDAVQASIGYGPATRLADSGAAPDVAIDAAGRAAVAWHAAGTRPARVATFTR